MRIHTGSRPPWSPLPRAWRAHALAMPGTVLLETAASEGDDHHSYLFTSPQRVLHADTAENFSDLLEQLDAATASGLYVAGTVAYEAGLALHGITSRFPSGTLACFGVYSEALCFDHSTGSVRGPQIELRPAPDELSSASLLHHQTPPMSRQQYAHRFARIHEHLANGDTYQVNFTAPFQAQRTGPTLDLYERLIEQQPVDYAAIVHLGEELILSFSPELFFRTQHDNILTRPMKGTAQRGATPEEDRTRKQQLAADEKNRAEHVMIVDLLRNDLGRICKPGSISVQNLFRVETYTTLHQMTSDISGKLLAEVRIADIFRAIFPSGSITGAPKRRTMQIIDELEISPRGIYTGAIGFAGPDSACFNVPIRTLCIQDQDVRFHAGGGIVADSTADAEYQEMELKLSFLSAAQKPLQLIETLLWNGETFPLLETHLDRLEHSAACLAIPFFRSRIHSIVMASTPSAPPGRFRLLLNNDGEANVRSTPLAGPTTNLRARLASRRILSTSPSLRHKTTRRALYDREFSRAQAAGFDEVLFLNERDELAEGAISNLFLQIGDTLYTPPLSAGCLPGVLRAHLLATRSDVQEKTLRLEDLASADAAFVGNALRGLRLIGSLEFE